jgi:hypothetical protein
MLSARCRLATKKILRHHGLHFVMLDLGEIEIMDALNIAQLDALKNALFEIGLDLLSETDKILIENLKGAVIELVHHPNLLEKNTFKVYLSKKLNTDYAYMANLFSEVSGMTLEQYFMNTESAWIKEVSVYGAKSNQ